MEFSVGGVCYADAPAALSAWTSIYGVGTFTFQVVEPDTSQMVTAICRYVSPEIDSTGAVLIYRACNTPLGADVWLPLMDVQLPACPEAMPNAESVGMVYAWGVVAVLSLWALGYGIGAAVKAIRSM